MQNLEASVLSVGFQNHRWTISEEAACQSLTPRVDLPFEHLVRWHRIQFHLALIKALYTMKVVESLK